MKTFTSAAVFAALAYVATANVCDNTDVDPCFATLWQDALNAAQLTGERFVTRNKSGYDLTMVRLIASPAGTSDGSKGPVLLIGGPRYHSSEWVSGANSQPVEEPTDTPNSTPQQLYDAGYDVWIAIPRGEEMSNTHETLDPVGTDPATGAAAYWNFGVDQIAKEDIPAMINYILTIRQGADQCQKVQLVGHDKGSNYAMITLNEFPTTSSSNIQRLISNTPCFFQDSSQYVAPTPDPAEQMMEMFDIWNKEDYYKERLDRQAYYAEFADVRMELTSDEYRKFYYKYRQWEQSNWDDWWKDYKWREGIKEAVCWVKPSSLRCQPADQASVASFFTAAETAGVVSFYGPDWATQIVAICAAEKPESCALTENIANEECQDSFLCTEYTSRPFGTATGYQEIPTGIAYHQVQQAFNGSWSKFNADWATTGFSAEPENYAVDLIEVPVNNIYVMNDDICLNEGNQKIGDTIPTQSSSVTLTDARTHFDAASIIGDNDSVYFSLLQAKLGTSEDLVGTVGSCEFMVFENWG